jgi:hypothetical protein
VLGGPFGKRLSDGKERVRQDQGKERGDNRFHTLDFPRAEAVRM